ncbi:MAG: glutaredoxin family protein [Desulfovibrionaceae bacterium]|jgi:glutaredoxin
MASPIKVYALSTCIHCKHAKEFLDEQKIPYDCVHVDQLTSEERKTILEVIRKLNPALSFPTIVIGDKVLVGFHRDQLEKAMAECPKS